MWRKLELNITPKCHTLFDHTIDQVVDMKGIADLAEDFVEKAHQFGKKLDHLVARMKCQSFCNQEMVKIRRQWLANSPIIIKQRDYVKQNRKRRKPSLPLTTQTSTRYNKKRQIKIEKRDKIERKLVR